jgi:hypothetical protein
MKLLGLAMAILVIELLWEDDFGDFVFGFGNFSGFRVEFRGI